MTKYLYKFSCKPNYPVVQEAMVIFWSSEGAHNFSNVMTEAKEIARNEGIVYVEDNPKLVYLGLFWPTRSSGDCIIAAISGEY